MRLVILFCFWFLLTQSTYANSSYDQQSARCNDLACVRAHIDDINNQLLELLAERTAYVRRAGIIKGPQRTANDVARVKTELTVITAKSHLKNLPVEISVPTFKTLIQASIDYQQKYKDAYFKSSHHS
jgi:chorismate mutase